MAEEAEQGGERTEEASPRRLQEARERGQIPRSRELGNFATMIGGSAALVAIGGRRRHGSPRSCAADCHSMRRARDPDSMLTYLGDDAISALTACCRSSAR
jgi:flagellar biosynthesis protein FlhB